MVGAIALSMGLHFMILYVPVLSSLFSIVPLNGEEWLAVILISLPIILIDEIMKLVSRIRQRRAERALYDSDKKHK